MKVGENNILMYLNSRWPRDTVSQQNPPTLPVKTAHQFFLKKKNCCNDKKIQTNSLPFVVLVMVATN